MSWVEIIAWVSLFILFYTYIGYGLLISLINSFKSSPENNREVFPFPEITLIIPAYNEKNILEEKWADCQLLAYPENKLQILFVTDGSTDGSDQWLKERGIPYIHSNERNGKTGAINHAMMLVNTPFAAICDANTRISKMALLQMVRHFEDPAVGAVNGEKKVITQEQSIQGEGLYWKYESFLKRMDAQFYTVAGAAGELLAFRKHLFRPFDHGIINDDLVLSLRIIELGYRIEYEPNAWAAEKASPDLKEEWKRKVRMNAGAWQAMRKVPSALIPWHNPRAFFQFFSHRVLRWTLCPIALFSLFFASAWLSPASPLFHNLFILQSVFYGIALMGWVMARNQRSLKWLNLPYYFFFMHLAMFPGFWRWVNGKQSANWESIKRHSL